MRLGSVSRYGALLAGTTMAGDGWVGDVRLLAVGLVVDLAAFACLLTERHGKPVSDAYEQGWQAGHNKGYMEGRRVGRPVVVDLTEWDEKVS